MNDDQISPTSPTGWQFNPGETVTPTPPSAPKPQPPAATQNQSLPTPAPVTTNIPQSNSFDAAEQTMPEISIEDQSMDASTFSDTDGQISWTASEYIAHHKTATWYVTLAIIAVVLAGGAYLLAHDLITSVSIVLIAFVFGLSAARKPRVLEYTLDNRGLKIAQKSYLYSNFRSFAVIDEGAFSSIVFVPLKRFMPMLTIYYAPEDENRIVQIIADHLPMEQRKHDAIDALLHKIRF